MMSIRHPLERRDQKVERLRHVPLAPGEFVGELALLDRGCRTAAVVAETPVVMMVSGAGEFAELLAKAPNMTRQLLAGLAGRLRTADLAAASA